MDKVHTETLRNGVCEGKEIPSARHYPHCRAPTEHIFGMTTVFHDSDNLLRVPTGKTDGPPHTNHSLFTILSILFLRSQCPRNVRLPRCSIRGDSPSRHIRHPTDAAPRASAASGIPLRVPLCPKPHPNIPPAKGSRSGRKWKIRTFRPIFRRMVGWYNRPLFDCTNIAKNLFCATFILNNTLTGPHPRQRPLIQHPFLEYGKGAHTARNRQYLNFILMEA